MTTYVFPTKEGQLSIFDQGTPDTLDLAGSVVDGLKLTTPDGQSLYSGETFNKALFNLALYQGASLVSLQGLMQTLDQAQAAATNGNLQEMGRLFTQLSTSSTPLPPYITNRIIEITTQAYGTVLSAAKQKANLGDSQGLENELAKISQDLMTNDLRQQAATLRKTAYTKAFWKNFGTLKKISNDKSPSLDELTNGITAFRFLNTCLKGKIVSGTDPDLRYYSNNLPVRSGEACKIYYIDKNTFISGEPLQVETMGALVATKFCSKTLADIQINLGAVLSGLSSLPDSTTPQVAPGGAINNLAAGLNRLNAFFTDYLDIIKPNGDAYGKLNTTLLEIKELIARKKATNDRHQSLEIPDDIFTTIAALKR